MRKLGLLVLVPILASFTGPAQAQDVTSVQCGTLAEADCEILQESAAALSELEAFTLTLDADLSIEDIPDLPLDLTFNLAGTLSVSGDLSAIVMDPETASALTADPERLADYFDDAFDDLGVDMDLSITLPEILVAQANGMVPSVIPLQARLVDGIGFLNFDPLREALGASAASLPRGWYGLDLAEVMRLGAAQQQAIGTVNPSAQAMSADMIQQFMNPEFLNQFVTVERLEDTAVDGEDVAQFLTTIDYSALIDNPDFRDMLTDAMQSQGDIDRADIRIALDAIEAMYQGLTVETTQTIGLEDLLPRTSTIAFTFDLAGMMEMMAEMGAADIPSGNAPVVQFDATVTFGDFNEVSEIAVPRGATVVTLEDLGIPPEMLGNAT